MAAINRAALVSLATSKLPGGTKASAQDVKDVLNAVIESVCNILDDKDANSGYAGLDVNGRIDPTKIFKSFTDSTGTVVMDDTKYLSFINSFAGAAVWTSFAKSGNRVFNVVNMGTGNLTINYPGAGNRIIDLASSIAPTNTIVIATKVSKKIIDDGNFLIFC